MAGESWVKGGGGYWWTEWSPSGCLPDAYGTDSERDIRVETLDFLVTPATGLDPLQNTSQMPMPGHMTYSVFTLNPLLI